MYQAPDQNNNSLMFSASIPPVMTLEPHPPTAPDFWGMQELFRLTPTAPSPTRPHHRGKPVKKRLSRRFSLKQKDILEKQFYLTKFLRFSDKKALSDATGLDEKQIQRWFYNRRVKENKFWNKIVASESIASLQNLVASYPGINNTPPSTNTSAPDQQPNQNPDQEDKNVTTEATEEEAVEKKTDPDVSSIYEQDPQVEILITYPDIPFNHQFNGPSTTTPSASASFEFPYNYQLSQEIGGAYCTSKPCTSTSYQQQPQQLWHGSSIDNSLTNVQEVNGNLSAFFNADSIIPDRQLGSTSTSGTTSSIGTVDEYNYSGPYNNYTKPLINSNVASNNYYGSDISSPEQMDLKPSYVDLLSALNQSALDYLSQPQFKNNSTDFLNPTVPLNSSYLNFYKTIENIFSEVEKP